MMFRLRAAADPALADAVSRVGRLLDEISRSTQPLVVLFFERANRSVRVVARPYSIPVVVVVGVDPGGADETFEAVLRATREAMKQSAAPLESAGVPLPLSEVVEALDGAEQLRHSAGPGAPRMR